MTTVVLLETLALGFLAVLVAGLLRSHAEILRRLHELGIDYGEEAGPGQHLARRGTGVRASSSGKDAPPLAGRSPNGDVVALDVSRPGERTLLLFLSSGCGKCSRFWDALRQGDHRQLDLTRTVVVTRDSDEESPSRLTQLAPSGVSVVLSSAAWETYGVPGSPFAVIVGGDGSVAGRGTASGWDQLSSLVAQADADSREARADHDLAAAGIHPGHPSLYPTSASPDRSEPSVGG